MIADIDRLSFAHNLNLAVANALKDETRVTKAVGVCKKVLQLFTHSWNKV